MPMSYPDRNIVNTDGALAPKNVDLFMEETEKVIRGVVKNGIDSRIFECAKTDYLASTLRSIETSCGRAFYISRKLLFKKKASIKDALKNIRAVKIEDCNALAEAIFGQSWNWAIMNPKK
jgi:predicted Zn-dependent peptidase